MVAVTQLVPDFLGGVSKQTDDKKKQGQVRDVLNGYPDPTFGMLKRNGMRFNYTLKKANGDEFTADELENAAWFFIQQGEQSAYFGCIKDTDIYVWNSITGVPCTVTNNGSAYLTGTKPEDYHFRSIQDVTIVTNKTIETALTAAPSYTANTAGTVVIKTVEYGAEYTVTLDGSSYTYKTRNSDDLADSNTERLDASEILAGIKGKIPGTYQVKQYKTSLEIRKSGNAFTLSCKGGIGGTALDCFQDEVDNVSKLPPESTNGRVVKITNYAGAEDDYYVTYKNGEWKESAAPNVSTGFDPNTMPHELVAISDTEFTFGPIDWKERIAGDDTTNPEPSFVGKTINCTFFYNNRFGMLSEDNVIMSVANDPYNFWAKSALTQVDSDPIDVQATSVKPTKLFAVLPCPQGLQLFARRQQFLMVSGQDSILTPSNVTIRGQSNYEMNDRIEPQDMGTRDVFISKVPGYTRAFTMQQRGIEETPTVIDISKTVSEWLPNTIDHMGSSPQNSFLALGSRNYNHLYIYKFYNNGDQDLFQSWVRWDMPGKIQAFSVMNDMLYGISRQANQYVVGVVSINDISLGVQTNPNIPSTPCLDMYTRPDVTYDEVTNKTTFTVGYKHVEGKEPIMVWVPNSQGPIPMEDIFALAGVYDYRPHNDAEQAPGYWTPIDVDGDNFSMRGDWTEYKDNIIVGYKFDYEVELPKVYYDRSGDGTATDYTASLTVGRVKFSVGKTGAVTFKLKAKGSDEWVDIQHVTDADYYEANGSPVVEERQFTVPIHQRNMNFNLKVTSDLPYPVSLVSMMWEGNYSPRFYRRK
jgi:hypothetical protein